MAKKVREVIKLIEANGFSLVSQRGSHRKFKKEGHPYHVVVSGKESDDVPIGTYKNILKQAGIDE